MCFDFCQLIRGTLVGNSEPVFGTNQLGRWRPSTWSESKFGVFPMYLWSEHPRLFFFLPKDLLPHFWSTFDVRWKFFSLKCELSQLKQRAYNNPSSESQIHISRKKNTSNPVWVMCIVLVQSIVTRAGADPFGTNVAAQNQLLSENINYPIIRVP